MRWYTFEAPDNELQLTRDEGPTACALTFDHVALVLAFAAFAAGCRNPQAEVPASKELEPIEFAAPDCATDGPSVTFLRAHTTRCGKGDTCLWVDERVRNPTARMFLLSIDDLTQFTASVSAVKTLQHSGGGSIPVWEVFGQFANYFVPVPAHADVVLRNIDLGFRPHSVISEYQVTFFDRVVVDHRHLEGIDAAAPRTGDLDLAWLHSFARHAETFPIRGGESVDVDAWCMQTIPIVFESGESS